MLATLKAIGLSDTELRDIKAADRKWVIVDYLNMIFDREYKAVFSTDDLKKKEAWSAERAALTGNVGLSGKQT